MLRLHIDIAESRAEEGKLFLFSAIERADMFAREDAVAVHLASRMRRFALE